MTNLLFSIVSVTTPICARCDWSWPPHHHVPTTNYAPGLVTTQTWANIEWQGKTKLMLLEESPPPLELRDCYLTNLIFDSRLIITNKVIVW